MLRKILIATAACTLTGGAASAGTVQVLAHPAPEGAELTFQLTDGRILAQSSANDQHWYTLAPDNKGSYVNGTWTRAADLPSNYAPYAYSSAVLADGRVLILGGEDSFGQFKLLSLGEIYDPQTNKWTALAHPPGAHWQYMGDSPSLLLPDGRFIVGTKLFTEVAAYDPKTGKWIIMGSSGKNDFNAEEGWTLLPSGRILTFDVKDHPQAELYDPIKQEWIGTKTIPVNLAGPPCCTCAVYGNGKCYHPPGEVGPGMLLPDGRVFAAGAVPDGEQTAHTALYSGGTWTRGPDIPNGDDAGDTFSVLLPSGNVLQEVLSGALYEFDGTSMIKQTPRTNNNCMLLLPTGQVLIAGNEVYNGGGSPQPSWAPTIKTFPSLVTRGSTYPISGTQFNGLSQANSFGDELQTYTNYPLIRITNNATHHTFYARTHDHSTMGVATGTRIVSTNFDVSPGMETGASSLVVVANGISSKPVSIIVN